MKFYIYIIYNEECDKFYIGQTNDLQRRIAQHKEGISNFTSKYGRDWRLIYKEEFENRSDAMNREKFLKKQKSKDFYKKLAGLK